MARSAKFSFPFGVTQPGGAALKLVYAVSILIVLALYASVVVTLTRLGENRGVVDDVCYQRQAQLYRDHGPFKGFVADSTEARYLIRKLAAHHVDARFRVLMPCETMDAKTDRVRIQYPFATGLLLSVFPRETQTSWLYIASTAVILMLVCGTILTSPTAASAAAVAAAGAANLYLMVNPSKASFSMPPTMLLCIGIALCTVTMLEARQRRTRLAMAATAGFLLGLAVDVRVSSALLAAGYVAIFAARLLLRRGLESIVQPALFGLAALIAVAPSLVSNTINSGNPLSTGYGAGDTMAPNLSWESLRIMVGWYTTHTHGALLWIAIVATAVLAASGQVYRAHHRTDILWIVLINLVINLGYFLTHPITSQYYTVPPAMLTIWTTVFAFRASEAASFGDGAQPVTHSLRAVRSVLGAAVVSVAAVMIVVAWALLAGKARPGATTVAIEPGAVLWTSDLNYVNPTARLLVSNLDRHPLANFDTAPPALADALIADIAADGRPQYFIVDDASMDELAQRAAAFGTLRPAGEIFGQKVYRLGAP